MFPPKLYLHQALALQAAVQAFKALEDILPLLAVLQFLKLLAGEAQGPQANQDDVEEIERQDPNKIKGQQLSVCKSPQF